ncbi:unnamed protein product, partial [Closterium sp. NIES-54]
MPQSARPGMYVDEGALKKQLIGKYGGMKGEKQLSGKYGGMKGEVLRGSRWLVEDAITADVTMAHVPRHLLQVMPDDMASLVMSMLLLPSSFKFTSAHKHEF